MNKYYERADSSGYEGIDITTGKIREWRSIITLIVFVLTSELYAQSYRQTSTKPYFDRHQRSLQFPYTFVPASSIMDGVAQGLQRIAHHQPTIRR